MGEGVSGVVPAAADVAADEADPEVLVRAADGAFVQARSLEEGTVCPFAQVVLSVATDGAAAATPFFEAGAVEHMLAEDSEEAGRFIHAFEANGTGWELDQCGGWGCFWFGAKGC